MGSRHCSLCFGSINLVTADQAPAPKVGQAFGTVAYVLAQSHQQAPAPRVYLVSLPKMPFIHRVYIWVIFRHIHIHIYI